MIITFNYHYFFLFSSCTGDDFVLNSLLDEYFAKTTVSTGSQLDYVHELP